MTLIGGGDMADVWRMKDHELNDRRQPRDTVQIPARFRDRMTSRFLTHF